MSACQEARATGTTGKRFDRLVEASAPVVSSSKWPFDGLTRTLVLLGNVTHCSETLLYGVSFHSEAVMLCRYGSPTVYKQRILQMYLLKMLINRKKMHKRERDNLTLKHCSMMILLLVLLFVFFPLTLHENVTCLFLSVSSLSLQ